MDSTPQHFSFVSVTGSSCRNVVWQSRHDFETAAILNPPYWISLKVKKKNNKVIYLLIKDIHSSISETNDPPQGGGGGANSAHPSGRGLPKTDRFSRWKFLFSPLHKKLHLRPLKKTKHIDFTLKGDFFQLISRFSCDFEIAQQTQTLCTVLRSQNELQWY